MSLSIAQARGRRSTHHLALILRSGVVVFANSAAADIFGFKTTHAFAAFAQAPHLISKNASEKHKNTTRFMKFKRVNEDERSVKIMKRHLEWNGVAMKHAIKHYRRGSPGSYQSQSISPKSSMLWLPMSP